MKASPPPAWPSRAATSAKMPTGEKYMSQVTTFIIASLKPLKKAMTCSPVRPRVVSAAEKTMAKTMIGSSLVSAAAATRFGLMSSARMSAPEMSFLASTSSAIPGASKSSPTPGWTRLTTTSPMNTAIAVVTTK